MSSVETTELKLKTTPTGGVDASHSPYYRRLLSAGYKGYLQGTIGGASLYGAIGMVIGTLIALPLIPFTAGASLALIPAAAGVGIVKGASTFGGIGSTAATLAESADLSEQRRYLLDRYYDLPEGPEGDKEAEAIKKELMRQHDSAAEAPQLFHWKTVAVCAAIGAVLVMAAIAAAPVAATMPLLAHFGVVQMIAHTLELGMGHALMTGAVGMSAGAAAGALTGAVVGLDRYYVRKWFDHTENIVHSSSHKESALIERSQQVARLKTAAKADEQTKATIAQAESITTPAAPSMPAAPVANLDLQEKPAQATLPAAEKPRTQISEARRMGLAEIQQAMDVPAL